MKKKTVLQLALMSVCATLLLIAGVAFAANAEPIGGDCGVYGDNVKWEFNPDSGELRIYGEGEMMDGSSPQYPWKKYREEIKIITIEDGVSSIGDNAFIFCYNLTHVEIPESVTSLGKWTFYRCKSLTSIDIPDNVTSIEDRTFSECSSLTDINIPDSVISIGILAFSGCSNLTNIIIPESVISIGESAFSSCSSLTSIYVPTGVTSIGEGAFAACYGLKNITVSSSNTMYFSFGNCLIERKSGKLILGCQNSKLPTDGSVISIARYAFLYSPLTNIDIPNSVTEIESFAFCECGCLESINIPSSVMNIGEDAFESCYSLKNVYISSSIIVDQFGEKDRTGLIDCADTVYINSAITEISDYIPANFPYTHTAAHDGTAYMAYSKTATVHDTLEGYIQFRPGDGVYDARVLVEGKSDFMEDYASATVTLTFTKNGDSNKTLTMTALADQAYTSVMACGQKKDARPGYGFIGLVITGIGNADVGTISASVTLTTADGDTFTYELGSVDNVPDYVGHPIA